MNFFYSIPLFVIAFSTIGDCAKIAVYNSYFAYSHFNYMAKLADILVEAGHNVTVIIPEIDPMIDVVSKKAKVVVRAPTENADKIFAKDVSQDLMWGNGIEAWMWRSLSFEMSERMNSQCLRLLNDTYFIESLKTEQFDFGIFEPIDFCGYGLFKLLGINEYATSSPMALSEEMAYSLGLPGRKVAFPMNHDYHPDMSFPEKLINHFSPYLYSWFNEYDEGQGMQIVKKYTDSKTSKFEILSNSRYIFVNTDENIDFPRPISHKIIYIGGITCDAKADNSNLSPDYKHIFDSTDGVVLISFGSLAKSSDMPAANKEAFLKMFLKFPKINFIWKYENESDSIANEFPNVFKRKWIPQKEILAHPKLLAFITHAGMNSVTEAAHFGIPLLAISLIADQYRNAKMLEYRKTTITLPKSEITASNLITALEALTQGDSGMAYRNRAKTLASMLASKPMSPKERFVKYINFAIQFRNHDDHLDIKLRNHNFFFFYNLDIYAFIGIIMLISLYSIRAFAKQIFCKYFSVKQKIV